MGETKQQRFEFIKGTLQKKCPAPTYELAKILQTKYPGSAIMLYGSGISVNEDARADEIVYDFYVITPNYKYAFKSRMLAFFNWMIPPNVFYIEEKTESGKIRAKYAVLSIDHFDKLVSKRTFHSYFWARFAQPSRLVLANDNMTNKITVIVEKAIDNFVLQSRGLVKKGNKLNEDKLSEDSDILIQAIWKAGLSKSYKAELRAETPDRVDKLLNHYGLWPLNVTLLEDYEKHSTHFFSQFAWRLRAIQGGVLSVLRLIKGAMTFEGGIDYIAWKISRHAGFELPVKAWERNWPILGIPILTLRYYKLKNSHSR